MGRDEVRKEFILKAIGICDHCKHLGEKVSENEYGYEYFKCNMGHSEMINVKGDGIVSDEFGCIRWESDKELTEDEAIQLWNKKLETLNQKQEDKQDD